MLADALDVALAVAVAFDRVGAPYFLGGSLASSLQGEPRASNDIDFVVDLREEQVAAFAQALGSDFSVDAVALERAVRERGSWNVYYLPLVTKIDLFILGTTAYDAEEFGRRRAVQVRPDGAQLMVKSPEDTILRKLLWYESAGRTSSLQWRDVVEVIRVSGASLDATYLDAWARRLNVADLLARARQEARPG